MVYRATHFTGYFPCFQPYSARLASRAIAPRAGNSNDPATLLDDILAAAA